MKALKQTFCGILFFLPRVRVRKRSRQLHRLQSKPPAIRSCEPMTCMLACRTGFERNDKGCPICACASSSPVPPVSSGPAPSASTGMATEKPCGYPGGSGKCPDERPANDRRVCAPTRSERWLPGASELGLSIARPRLAHEGAIAFR